MLAIAGNKELAYFQDMTTKSFVTGTFFILLSATGIALLGLLGKLGNEFFTLEALIFWRYLTAFFLCILLFAFLGKLRQLSLKNFKIHFLRAFFVLSAQYSFYFYIQRNTLLNGLVLLSLGPLLIPLIEWVIHRHPIGKSTRVGLVVSFVGVLFILQPDKSIFSFLSLIGVLAGVCQGVSQVVFGISSKKEKAELSLIYLFFFCTVLSLFPYLLFASFSVSRQEGGIYSLLLLFALGIVSILTQFTRAIAYKHGTPSRLATFLYFSILLGGVFDWVVFNKEPNSLSVLGTIFVVLGGFLKIYLRSKILKNK